MKHTAVHNMLKNNPGIKLHEMITVKGGLRYQITYKGKPRTLRVNPAEVAE